MIYQALSDCAIRTKAFEVLRDPGHMLCANLTMTRRRWRLEDRNCVSHLPEKWNIFSLGALRLSFEVRYGYLRGKPYYTSLILLGLHL